MCSAFVSVCNVPFTFLLFQIYTIYSYYKTNSGGITDIGCILHISNKVYLKYTHTHIVRTSYNRIIHLVCSVQYVSMVLYCRCSTIYQQSYKYYEMYFWNKNRMERTAAAVAAVEETKPFFFFGEFCNPFSYDVCRLDPLNTPPPPTENPHWIAIYCTDRCFKTIFDCMWTVRFSLLDGLVGLSDIFNTNISHIIKYIDIFVYIRKA